jgi:indole-3-glycerol phosphate synthase
VSQSLLPVIVAAARRSAAARQDAISRAAFERAVARRAPRGAAFTAALAAPGVRIIAECKGRSPSRGVLRQRFDPAAIASGYAAAGAAAVSVLTEPTFFDGALAHLEAVRAAVGLPLLRKDFIVTEFQVEEARAAGADAVLLIVAALDDGRLRRLRELAAELDLATLVEVHDEEELGRALDAGADIVGVNSRDLKSLAVTRETFDRLAPSLPASVIAVAESGLGSAAEVARLRTLRYDAFLVGERFMTSPDPGAALRALRLEAEAGDTR